uniref:tRNA N(3)-methylcytidine methyltransferase n=1 Tax=Myxobolus squamalis TaxID=59785 RepID=A0A6B2G5C4_MYXSQ
MSKQKQKNRHLQNLEMVFTENAWDDVEWKETQQADAEEKIQENSSIKMNEKLVEGIVHNPKLHWDKFYETHKNKFFKDKNWLFSEFPELSENPLQNINKKILEVGCGAGNIVFPILKSTKQTAVYCCDFSSEAIANLKSSICFDASRCYPFVCDLTDFSFSYPIPLESLDIIICIFVLSAIPPHLHQHVICNLSRLLKPGGTFLFRDYGRCDMTQLRFKRGQCIEDNLYSRGDSTIVYFATLEKVNEMFIKSGFEIVESNYDRRLLVNRRKKLQMYRVWIQSRLKKL